MTNKKGNTLLKQTLREVAGENRIVPLYNNSQEYYTTRVSKVKKIIERKIISFKVIIFLSKLIIRGD
jgi:riboflavin transporter FmnP